MGRDVARKGNVHCLFKVHAAEVVDRHAHAFETGEREVFFGKRVDRHAHASVKGAQEAYHAVRYTIVKKRVDPGRPYRLVWKCTLIAMPLSIGSENKRAFNSSTYVYDGMRLLAVSANASRMEAASIKYFSN